MSPPSESRGRVLVVEDDQDVRETLAQALPELGVDVDVSCSAEEALQDLGRRDYDVVLTDLRLGGRSGIDLCREISANWPDLPTIIITGFGDLDAAVDAIRAGAYDFITKPFQLDFLIRTVERAVQNRELRSEVARLREGPVNAERLGDLFGESECMREVCHLIGRAVNSDLSVLVTGETGTGKELVARALHECGPRGDGPFLAVNCAALPAHLLESELFGHERGAFTDARESRKGLFLRAHRGTLLLDEIADMPLELQGKVLRTLQEARVRPVGSDEERSFDVRIVAATNRNITADLASGRFRQDLYYRINVIHIALPPLRQRGRDVLLLAQHFLEQAATRQEKAIRGFQPEVAARFRGYGWPGNVRELKNAIERAVMVCERTEIQLRDLPETLRAAQSVVSFPEGRFEPGEFPTLAEVERTHILKALAVTEGNKKRASELLGVDRGTLYRKLDRHGIVWQGSGRP